MYNMEPETTNTTNIQSTTFIDQAPILPSHTHITGDSFSNETRTAVTDQDWDIQSLMSKPIIIGTYPWASSDTPGTHTVVTRLPPPLLTTSAYASNHNYVLRTMFMLYKFDIIIRAVINGTRYHFGRNSLWFNPLDQLNIDPAQPLYNTPIQRISGMPHMLLDPSTNSTTELHIPYTHYRHLLPTVTDAASPSKALDFGSLVMTPWTALGFATGSTDPINISIFWSVGNAKLHIPRPLNYAVAQGLESILSAALDIGGKVATGNIGGAVSSGLDTASKIGKGFAKNRDRPSTSGSELAHRTAAMTTPFYLKGPSATTRLSAFPSTETTLSPSVVNSQAPETQIKQIIQRTMLYTTFTCNTSDNANVFSEAIAPTMRTPATSTGLPSGFGAYHSTYMSYFLEPFTYWKGTINFRFEFVKSPFHVGRYCVMHFPNTEAPPVVTHANYPSYSTLPHAIIDLAESSVVDFSVSFVSTTSYKIIPPLPFMNSTFFASNFAQINDYINGQLVVFPLNPLVTTLGMPTTIFCLVYVSAGPDFEFYVPRHPSSFPLLPVTQEEGADPTTARAQNDEPQTESTTTEPSGVQSLNAGPNMTVPERTAFIDEDITDIIDLCRRFTFTARLPLTNGSAFQMFGFYVNLLDATKIYSAGIPTGVLPDYGMNMLNYFAISYLGYRGSVRYMFVPNLSKNAAGRMEVTHIPQTYLSREIDLIAHIQAAFTGNESGIRPMLSNYATHRIQFAQNPIAEIEVPFYSIYDFLLRPDAYQATLTTPDYPAQDLRREPTFLDQGFLAIAYDLVVDGGDSTEAYSMDILKAAGDDFNFFFLLAPPTVGANLSSPYYTPSWTTPPAKSQNDDIKLILNEKQHDKGLTPFDIRNIPIIASRHARNLRKLYVQNRSARSRHIKPISKFLPTY